MDSLICPTCAALVKHNRRIFVEHMMNQHEMDEPNAREFFKLAKIVRAREIQSRET